MKLNKAEIILLFTTLIWGLTFPLIKGAVSKVSPFAFLSMRFFLASLVLLFFTRLKLKRENIIWGVLIGFFLFMGMASQTIGLIFTKASRSGFITGFLVFIVPILNYIIFRKKSSIFSLTGVLLAITGLYLLLSPEGGGFNIGDLLTLLSALFFAFQVIFIEHSTNRYEENTIVTVQIFTTFLLSFIFSLTREKWNFKIDTEILIAVIITGIFATSIAFILQGKFQRETTATRAGIIYSMEPVFAFLFSSLILGETLPEKGIMGGFLVFLGMLISNFEKKD